MSYQQRTLTYEIYSCEIYRYKLLLLIVKSFKVGRVEN